jgi:hypothetical protein
MVTLIQKLKKEFDKAAFYHQYSDIHNINTRYKLNLYLPSTNLTSVQKGVLFSGSKIYNHLPLNIKIISKDIKHSISSLRIYFTEHAFYSIDEYYQFLMIMVL